MLKDYVRAMLNGYRAIPTFLLVMTSKQKHKIKADIELARKITGRTCNGDYADTVNLLLHDHESRNLLFHRLHYDSKIRAHLFKLLFRRLGSLTIVTREIGAPLYIQHGFGTSIMAKSIGAGCWINQMVTIGYEQDRTPTIGNHVRICVGATIIGDVTVGDNSIIGAGAVVTSDVPPNSIYGGVPARFIKAVKGSSFDDQRR